MKRLLMPLVLWHAAAVFAQGGQPAAQSEPGSETANPVPVETSETPLPSDGAVSGEPSDQDLGKLPTEEVGELKDAKMMNMKSVTDTAFREVAKDLRCPTCTGLSVLESDASFSVQIKDQVKEQMQLGKNKEQILDFFVARYGPWILREPPTKGFNLLAWLIPIVLLCVGPIVIWVLVWKRRVHVNIHGVRANEVIIAEMQEKLRLLKQKGA